MLVLGVSLHNPNIAGDRLKYMIDWIAEKKNFKKCYIDLSDTLYRHNYMLVNSIPKMKQVKKAVDQGNKWLNRHQEIIDRLDIPVSILRWDQWLNNPEFCVYFRCSEK